MDNITHTLIGVTVGEVAGRASSEPNQSWFRRLCLMVSIGANNLPDIDFIYTGVTGGKLGYLLHHRGHTHTLLALFPSLFLLLGVVWLLCRWKKVVLSRAQWIVLAAVGSLGHVLHIGMDFFNNYGVHPFWPWNNAWYYGDTLFIIEPWMWVLLSGALFSFTQNRWVRALSVGVGAIAVGLGAITGFVPPVMLVALGIMGLAFPYILGRLRPQVRSGIAIAAWVGVTVTFFSVGKFAKSQLAKALQENEADYVTHDLVLTPMPANPFCWGAISAQVKGDEYRVRRGIYAPFPAIWPAENCPQLMQGRGTAQLTRPQRTLASESQIAWKGQYQASLTEMKRYRSHCAFAAFLQYSRVPFWRVLQDRILYGDIRYDRQEGLDFADDEAPLTPTACPKNLPPWVPPRMRMFRG